MAQYRVEKKFNEKNWELDVICTGERQALARISSKKRLYISLYDCGNEHGYGIKRTKYFKLEESKYYFKITTKTRIIEYRITQQ